MKNWIRFSYKPNRPLKSKHAVECRQGQMFSAPWRAIKNLTVWALKASTVYPSFPKYSFCPLPSFSQIDMAQCCCISHTLHFTNKKNKKKTPKKLPFGVWLWLDTYLNFLLVNYGCASAQWIIIKEWIYCSFNKRICGLGESLTCDSEWIHYVRLAL